MKAKWKITKTCFTHPTSYFTVWVPKDKNKIMISLGNIKNEIVRVEFDEYLEILEWLVGMIDFVIANAETIKSYERNKTR